MKLKQIFLYLFFYALMFLFFFYAAFPEKEMGQKISRAIEQESLIKQVKIETVSLWPPLTLRLERMLVSLKNGINIPLDKTFVKPEVAYFFGKEKKIKLISSLFDGEINARIGYSKGIKNSASLRELFLSGMKIENAAYNVQSARVLMSCDLDLSYEPIIDADDKDQLNLDIQNIEINLEKSLLNVIGLDQLQFSRIKMAFIHTKEKLEIKNGTALGSEMNINLKGHINIRPELGNSQLQLEGTILPNSKKISALMGLKDVKKQAGTVQKKGLLFRITGTLTSPEIKL